MYEPYHTDTYSNVIVKRSDFNKNEEQYLMPEVVDIISPTSGE